MLRDSAHIQEFEAEWRNRKGRRAGVPEFEPLYVMADAEAAINLFVPCGYGERLHICDGVEIRFTDVGHLLGSASIEVWITEGEISRKIVFSGDVGNADQPIIKDPRCTDTADYVVVESTYGNRVHSSEKIDYVSEFTRILKETFDAGGNFDEEAIKLVDEGINPLVFPGLKTSVTSDDSKLINFIEKPKVIISASGMCDAGRIRHHLKHNLWRKECTILFVGYQANGTLGRRLLEGEKNIKLFGEPIEVHARIESLHGISGHADMNGLIAWLKGFKTPLQHVFVVHGEDTVTEEFAQKVEETLGCPAWAPFPNGEVDLAANEILNEGVRIAVKGKKPSQKKADAAFERLIAAGRRLLDVIYRREGIPNKDKAKFESQINNLADKWDRWE